MATIQRFEDIIAWQKINYIVKFLLTIVLWLNPLRGSLFPQLSNHGLHPWLLLLMSVGHSSNPLNSGLTIACMPVGKVALPQIRGKLCEARENKIMRLPNNPCHRHPSGGSGLNN